ncbi:hypothetical protein SY89_03092 [Halolamina pelagica]|uniref:Glycosyltransferase RgtA/B/C/D-like domain-containing protein n=2 Tax=Halolamina pelagica TaxID=699431 RepID=A0A0P7HYJ3_9EURY|nr:hypothetical protein SY89_03092 [Halolamina pelagica]
MYHASPLFIIELVIGKLVAGDGIVVPFGVRLYDAGGITIAVAAFTPVLIYGVGSRNLFSKDAALVAAILSVPFPLFLRSSTITQSEHLAVPLFLVVLIVLLAAIGGADRRYNILAVGLLLSVVWVHFFYATVIISISTGILLGCYFLRWLGMASDAGHQNRWIAIIVAPVLLLLIHILWSAWRSPAIGVLMSVFTFQFPANPLELILPSSGQASQSVGRNVESGVTLSAPLRAIKYYPLLYTCGLGVGGGIVYLWARLVRQRDIIKTPFIVAMLSAGLLTVGALIASINFKLHYRMFYFIGPLLILGGSVFFIYVRDTLPTGALKRATVAILLITAGGYAAASPISPLGNDIDNPLIDMNRVYTNAEWDQYMAIERFNPNDAASTERLETDVKNTMHGPLGESHLTITDNACGNKSQIWASEYYVCNTRQS